MRKKQSAYDFRKQDLPANRVELFFDVLKNNWRNLLLIGVILLAFSLPFLSILYYFDYLDAAIYQDFLKGVYTEEQYFGYYKLNRIIAALSGTLGLMILSLGISGAMKIIKKMCFLEPYFFKDDFLSGIKENWSINFLIALITGLLSTLATLVFFLDIHGVIKGISIGVPVLIVFPIFFLMIPMNALYKLTFFSAYLNGFKLLIKYLLKNTLFYLIMMIPITLLIIPHILIKYLAIIIFIIGLAPLFLVGLFDYSLALFDEAINKENYPAYYRKGLYGDKTLREQKENKSSE